MHWLVSAKTATAFALAAEMAGQGRVCRKSSISIVAIAIVVTISAATIMVMMVITVIIVAIVIMAFVPVVVWAYRDDAAGKAEYHAQNARDHQWSTGFHKFTKVRFTLAA